MNNTEKITNIQNDINKFIENYVMYEYEEEIELFERILNVFEELKKPQSLADFLGWEEDTEYTTDHIFDDYKYKAINNQLYFTKPGSDWKTYSVLDFWGIKQAKKVKLKKYHLRLKRKYVDFFDTFGGKNLLSLYDCKDFMISDASCEDDKNQIEFTEEEINNIVLPEPLSLDMFDKVEVKLLK